MRSSLSAFTLRPNIWLNRDFLSYLEEISSFIEIYAYIYLFLSVSELNYKVMQYIFFFLFAQRRIQSSVLHLLVLFCASPYG